MSYYEADLPRRASRAREILNKLERVYLATIRAIALIAATLLVVYAIWLVASGLYKSSRDADSVKESPAAVSADEVTDINLSEITKTAARPTADPLASEKQYYADFTKRYHALFKQRFEPFKKADDQALDQKAFDQRFVRTNQRLEAIKDGSDNFAQDQADLDSLLETMTAAAGDAKTVERLQAYKAAKKIAVNRTESGTREETYCSYYGVYIDECISYATRTIPYTRTVRQMKLPAGVVSHTDLFGAYQDRYLSKLTGKREANASSAQREREAIMADNAKGQAQLWFALSVIGAFVVLMFLFLLIALERHQRKIAASVSATN